MMIAGLQRVSRKAMPAVVVSWIARLRRRSELIPLTSRPVNAIGGLEPISRTFGYDRSTSYH
jgi:hypothetical protein